MAAIFPAFRSGAIAPLECVKEGWALIKDQYWLFLGLTIVGILIASAVPIVLIGPMMVGIFLCLFQRQRHEPVEFGTLFKGFDYFGQSLIVALIKVIPIVILMVPFYIIMFAVMMTGMPRGRATPEQTSSFLFSLFGLELLFVIVLMVVGIAIEVFFMFAFPLVADRKLSGLDAIKVGFGACKANFGGVLGLLLLNALFGILGVLCCLVGVYLYLPVSFASYAVAYRRVFPDVPESFNPPPPPPPSGWA